MNESHFDTRESGIPSIPELPWGCHLCQFYETKEDLLDVLVPYFRAGLEANEFCCWVVSAPLSVTEARNALGEVFPRLSERLAAGQIEIIPGDIWKSSDADVGGILNSRLDQAVTRNLDGLRFACPALPQEQGRSSSVGHGFESIASLNVIAIFLYPRSSVDAIGLMEVVKRHRMALIRGTGRWEVLESAEALTVKDTLRRTEEKLLSLFNNMSEGFAFHRIVLDAAGKPCDYVFLEINEMFKRLTSLEADEIIGKRVTSVFPGIEKDPSDWIGKYGEVALTGQPIRFESYSPTLQHWYSVSAFSPRKGFFGCTFADITERKCAETELLAIKERLRVTLTSIGDAVLSTDAEGRVTFLNPVAMAMTGWTEAECLGRPAAEVFRIVNESSDEPIEDIIKQVLRDRKVIALANQTVLVAKNGRRIPIEDSAAPISTGDGQIAGAVLVFHDVTSKRRAHQALQRSHEELEERVAERTEQLKRANLQIEARAAQLRELATELTLAEQRERRRIALLLHDNLQQLLVGAKFRVSTLERSSDAQARAAGVALAALLDEAIQSSRSLTAEISPPVLYEQGLLPALRWLIGWILERHGLTVELSSETLPAQLAQDMSVLLFESVREILFNIVKHAGVDRAYADVRCTDGKLQISILDKGMGFDPDPLRSSGTSSGGFGLFSIRERLSLLGGELQVESARGKGTRVTLCTPAVLAPLQSKPEDRRRIRILLVDDHPIMRDGIARLFEHEPDIEVVGEAADGRAAIERANELQPDVVLMDVNMPGIGGIEATRIIRKQLSEVKVVGLSMYDDIEVTRAMLAAGASEHLSKGGRTDEIVRAVRACTKQQAPAKG